MLRVPFAIWPGIGTALLASLLTTSSWLVADEPATELDLRAGVERARASVFKVECIDLAGRSSPSVLSAVAIDDEGYLVTIGLRALEDRQLCVRDRSGRKFDATWVACDELSGLTLLKVDPAVVHAAPLAKKLPEIGSTIMVVGNPFGLSHSVSVGNVSGLERSVGFSGGVGRGLIQFTAPVFPGDSGGLLADRNGRMLGLVSTALGDPTLDGGQRIQGIGFAIPAEELRLVAQRLRDGEKIERGYLGITVEDGDSAGARITSVPEGSPAHIAGLQVGDVIESLDAMEIRGFEDLATRIERLAPGTRVKLNVRRGAEELAVDVVLGERELPSGPGRRPAPPNWPDRPSRPDLNSPRDFRDAERWSRYGPRTTSPEGALLGVQTQPVTEALAKSLALKSTDGALVSSVVPGSPADRAGLRTSDLIVGVDGEAVNSPLQLHERIQRAGPGATVRLGIVRDGRQETMEIVLAMPPVTPMPPDPGEVMIWPRGLRHPLVPDLPTSRIEALEERVRVLQKRIEALEERLRSMEHAAPAADKP